ncbi:YCF48-related protein [soil metagenome]
MPLKKVLFIAGFVFSAYLSYTQNAVINILDSGRKTSIRGLSVVDDDIVWASGSNGTVARSVDGGKTFEWLTVAGYEKRDFRDIESFDKNTAIIMGIAEPAIILKTKDGGKKWYKVFEDTTKGMFLDALDFSNEKYGTVIGDPINEKMFVAHTFDKGETWHKDSFPPALSQGEAMFASSGTNIKSVYKTFFSKAIVTGGNKSSIIFLPDNPKVANLTIPLPILQGKESTGANSLAVFKKRMFIVGGDFANDKDTTRNSLLSNNSGKTWRQPTIPPHGYRSCIEYITKDKLITCGTSGVDISNDGGMNWELISTKSFHVCQKAKKGNKVFLAGGNGKIAILTMQ